MLEAEILHNFLKDSGLKYKNGAKSYIFTCPLCNKKDKLYIRKSDGRFVCFHCKESENFFGKPEFALSKLLNLSVQEVQNKLYNFIPVKFEEFISVKFKNAPFNDFINEELIEEEIPTIDFLYGVELPPDFVPLDSPAALDAIKYLNFRGITEELVKKYQIKYHPTKQRIIFPVIVNNQLLGWQGRFIYDCEPLFGFIKSNVPKILTSEGLAGGKYVMFQDNLENSEHAIILEGPVDAIKADLCHGNIATMGKGVTKAQLETILSYSPERIYLGLDRDAAEDANRICLLIHELSDNSIPVYFMTPPSHREDFGDCTVEETLHQFQIAFKISLPQIFLYFKE